jgi:hypothetical protein
MLVRIAALADSISAVRRCGLRFRGRRDLRFPADSWLPGQIAVRRGTPIGGGAAHVRAKLGEVTLRRTGGDSVDRAPGRPRGRNPREPSGAQHQPDRVGVAGDGACAGVSLGPAAA